MIENLGKTATLSKMTKDHQEDSVRESETIELDFCSTRYQQRRSTFVEAKSNPLFELGLDEDIDFPEIQVGDYSTAIRLWSNYRLIVLVEKRPRREATTLHWFGR
jgi:hypothetical protein